jgi:4'-phosphopantetheinyl transferase
MSRAGTVASPARPLAAAARRHVRERRLPIMSERPALRSVATRLWHVDIDAAAPALLQLEDALPRLSPDEQRRRAAMSDRHASRRWAAAHVALRLVLEREVGAIVRRQAYVTTPAGKPELPAHGIAFSLAHADGLALVATGARAPLGVDIETTRLLRMSRDRRLAIQAGAERLAGQPLPRGDVPGFLQAWVRIEAVAKAEGLGLAVVLAMTGAYGPRRGTVDSVALDRLAGDLALVDLALGPGVYACVAMPAGSTGAEVTQLPADIDGLQAFALGR